MLLEIIAGQALQFGPDPEMMLAVGFVHGFQGPGYPADAAFDQGELQLGKAFQNARSTHIRHGLDGRAQGMGDIIDHRAAVALGGAGIPARGNMEGDLYTQYILNKA